MGASTRPVIALLLAGLVLTACSSTAKTATPRASGDTTATTAGTPTTQHVDYAHQYLRIIAPGNAAIETFQTRVGALPLSATIDDLSRLTAPLADSLDVTSQKLLRATWPTKVRQDIKELVVAVSAVIADLRNVSSQNLLTIRTWKDQLSGDLRKARGHVALVRSDLGLPPAKHPPDSARTELQAA